MQEALDGLKSVLEKEKAIYGELLMLAEHQRDALITRNINALMGIANHQGKLLKQADRIGQKANQVLSVLAERLGIDKDGINISDVVEKLDKSRAKPIRQLRDQIYQAAARLAQVNQVNSELFNNALSMIQYTMRLIANSQQAPEPYYPSNESVRQPASVLVDQRV